ncbi:MAG: hypothetical protein H8M99_06885 [Gloeobacteraceae cyanobacterium ES-bin-144]|nr:hypothetical protein [Verrucomicrobiales bacterium]
MPIETESDACHLCGNESVLEVDGVAWCAACLHAKGSCCGESDMEDSEESDQFK